MNNYFISRCNRIGTYIFRACIFLVLSTSGMLLACPTCIGVIEHTSPKFFSNDAYDTNDNQHNNTTVHERNEQ